MKEEEKEDSNSSLLIPHFVAFLPSSSSHHPQPAPSPAAPTIFFRLVTL
jgi:hypothetical protein